MAIIQLSEEENEQLLPLFEFCDAYLAGVKAALDAVKRKATEDIIAERTNGDN